jgi:hypothetical protein
MRYIFHIITVALFSALLSTPSFAQSEVLDGTWVGMSPAAEGLLRLVIRGSEVRAFWTCRPNPCDLGLTIGTFYSLLPASSGSRAFIATFTPVFGEVVVIVSPRNATESQVQTYTRYSDGSGRADFADTQIFIRLDDRGSELQPMPPFPWPPPKWTSRYLLPDGLVTSGRPESLGTFFDRIVSVLRKAAVEEWSSYAIENDGFAIVSRLESIDDNGRPRPGAQRWGTRASAENVDSLKNYLTALFKARTGRYRVIAFIVTSLPVVAGAEPADAARMNRLLREGATALPESMRARVANSVRCEALVYEFFQASADEPMQLVESSHLTPTQHLAGAGLWRVEDLRQ